MWKLKKYSDHIRPSGRRNAERLFPRFSEYEVGDYERSFSLPEEIDQEKIKATIKNGVLRLELPKTDKVKPKKITINAT